jgi:8-oxo-dGTP pyrophosphatase MutT (NUDIX family)
VPVEPRPAASVALIRPGASGGGAPLEAYLIRRAATMRFLGGYYAFPGGKVDRGDQDAAALERVRGLTAAEARRRLDAPDDPVPPLAYWVTAVRELFEETGLLLAVDEAGRAVDAGAPAVAGWLETARRQLVTGERTFPGLLAERGWAADLRSLAYLGLFVTPVRSPIRFSARFFLCPLPPDQVPRVILEEASEGVWAPPAAAYARFLAGEWPMAEPAEYTMRYLAQFASEPAVWAHHAGGQAVFDGIIDRLEDRFDWSTAVRRA